MKKFKILIIDDQIENIDVLKEILEDQYVIYAIKDSTKVVEFVKKNPPDIILLDIMMPEIDGYELCITLKKDPLSSKIPIIFITADSSIDSEEKGLKLGAVDYITKPIKPAVVRARVETHLELYSFRKELEEKVIQRTKEIEDTKLQIIRILGRAAEFKDNETGMHVIRMSHYSKLIASVLFPDDKKWVDLIFKAAPMHDIGKIGIPDHILQKEGSLDEDEWKIMKDHPNFGAEIIGDDKNELLRLAGEIALAHHEKYDGTGYPRGLKGKDIPLSARIITIADVFDALTTKRPYKEAWDTQTALQYMEKNTGKHFDPEIFAVFKSIIPQVMQIKEKYSETGINQNI
jgi:putative two-component system response regulator